MIVSDFCFYPGQRERGPIMSFIRCDRGSTPADHHTLAMALGPVNRYVHSAYQVCDLDALAAGGEYLREQGYFRSWGIGRHVQGSQIFDYWRDPDGFLVEHFADGDMFDNTLEPGWAPLSCLRAVPVGTPPSKDFLGVGSPRETASELAVMVDALAPRQRIRPVRPARAVQRSQFLTVNQPKERRTRYDRLDPAHRRRVVGADPERRRPHRHRRGHHRRAAGRPCGHRRRRARHRHRAGGKPCAAVADHDAMPRGGSGHQLRLACAKTSAATPPRRR